MKITILVVVYKERVTQSSTYIALQKAVDVLCKTEGEYNIIFHDNSPADFAQDGIAEIVNFFNHAGVATEYFHTPQNLPLSNVYNTTLERVKDSADYLVLLDQDSTFEPDYFIELDKCKHLQPLADVILPVVYFKNQIISPTKVFFIKGFYFKNKPGGYLSCALSAINSGMVISLDFIKRTSFRYSDRLKNYCTDDAIMKHARDNDARIYIINYSFEHDLTLSTLNSNSDKLRSRYNEMIQSKKIVFGKGYLDKRFLDVYYFIHRLYMCVRFKDWKYIKAEK